MSFSRPTIHLGPIRRLAAPARAAFRVFMANMNPDQRAIFRRLFVLYGSTPLVILGMFWAFYALGWTAPSVDMAVVSKRAAEAFFLIIMFLIVVFVGILLPVWVCRPPEYHQERERLLAPAQAERLHLHLNQAVEKSASFSRNRRARL